LHPLGARFYQRFFLRGLQRIAAALFRRDALEIISEASRRLPDELRNRHPDLPWRDIRDAGNMYRHSYDNVVEAIIWKTVQEDLAPLLAVVVAEIEALDSDQ